MALPHSCCSCYLVLLCASARVGCGTAQASPGDSTHGRVFEFESELKLVLGSPPVDPPPLQQQGPVVNSVGAAPVPAPHTSPLAGPNTAPSLSHPPHTGHWDALHTSPPFNVAPAPGPTTHSPWSNSTGQVTRGLLRESIERKDLGIVYLWRYAKPSLLEKQSEKHPPAVLQCQALQCPSFGSCGDKHAGFRECVEGVFNDTENVVPDPPLNCPLKPSPTNSTESSSGLVFDPQCAHMSDGNWHDKFEAQVFEIRGGVYVWGKGITFTPSSVVFRHGCVLDDPDLRVREGGEVVRVQGPMMGLLYYNAGNYYHALAESVPSFLQAATFLRDNPLLPVLMHCEQRDMYRGTIGHIMGIPVEDMNVVCINSSELIFTDHLLQPVFQSCGYPSPSTQHFLRERFYLPQGGLPLFHRGWRLRDTTPLSHAHMGRIPRDWVVVYAQRPRGGRRLKGERHVLSALHTLFGSERVCVFNGSLSVLAAKELFNRAALLVGPHGAALTNMLFMPVNSTVLEIRPRDYPVACYHHLASACNIRYYLILGKGGKWTPLVPNISEIVGVLRVIKRDMVLP